MNIAYINNGLHIVEHEEWATILAQQTSRELVCYDDISDDIELFCNEHNIDIIIFSCINRRKAVNRILAACRELRLPYVILTDTMRVTTPIRQVLSPITMLEEETYKAEILGHLARFTKADIILLQPNDYGSRAMQNISRITTTLESTFNVSTTSEAENHASVLQVIKGKKNSFTLNREAAERMTELNSNLLVITASREYGLDDILFGPSELHAVQHSSAPVLLINPRSDLFSLCD